MKTIQVFEFDTIPPDAIRLTPSDERMLQRFNNLTRNENGNDAITITYGKITTYSYVGIIQIGRTRIEILPKLCDPDRSCSLQEHDPTIIRNTRKNLFSMLSFSGLVPVYKGEISTYDETKDFFEFWISLFLKDLEKALIAQLNREYVSREDELSFIRGKIDFNKEFRKLPSERNRFSCIYDDFSPDNILNQIIKAALKKIR